MGLTVSDFPKVRENTSPIPAWSRKCRLGWIISSEVQQILELGRAEIEPRESIVTDVVEIVGPQFLSRGYPSVFIVSGVVFDLC